MLYADFCMRIEPSIRYIMHKESQAVIVSVFVCKHLTIVFTEDISKMELSDLNSIHWVFVSLFCIRPRFKAKKTKNCERAATAAACIV